MEIRVSELHGLRERESRDEISVCSRSHVPSWLFEIIIRIQWSKYGEFHLFSGMLNCPLRNIFWKKSRRSIFLPLSHCRNIMNEDLYDLVELNGALLISRFFEHPQMPLRKRRSIDATFGDYRTVEEDHYSFSTCEIKSHEIKSNNAAYVAHRV